MIRQLAQTGSQWSIPALRRRFLKISVFTPLLFGSAVGMLAGCQHKERARRAVDARWAKAGRTIETAIEREREGSARMSRTIRAFVADVQQDEIETRENFRELGRLIQADFRRWDQRQPDYAREVEALLRGKPEMLEPIAIELFLE